MGLGWNGGQGGRVWQKKTNSFFLSCCFITHALGHPVPILSPQGPLHSTCSRRACRPCWPALLQRRGRSSHGLRLGEREGSGSCWCGGLSGGGSWDWVGTQELPLLRGRRETLALQPLPFANSVAAVVSVSHSPWGEARRVQPLLSYWAFFQLPSTLLPLWTGCLKSDHRTFLLPPTVVFSRRDCGDQVGRNPSMTRKGTGLTVVSWREAMSSWHQQKQTQDFVLFFKCSQLFSLLATLDMLFIFF